MCVCVCVYVACNKYWMKIRHELERGLWRNGTGEVERGVGVERGMG